MGQRDRHTPLLTKHRHVGRVTSFNNQPVTFGKPVNNNLRPPKYFEHVVKKKLKQQSESKSKVRQRVGHIAYLGHPNQPDRVSELPPQKNQENPVSQLPSNAVVRRHAGVQGIPAYGDPERRSTLGVLGSMGGWGIGHLEDRRGSKGKTGFGFAAQI